MKKIISILMIICILVSTSITSFAALDTTDAQTALNLIDKQNFSNTTSKEKVKNYINHFLFHSKFAALTGGKFNYPNSHDGWFYSVSDGKYTKSIYDSKGCMAYCYFVSEVIYNDGAEKQKKYYKTSGDVTASGLKEFIETYAQAGEHLRVSGKHSVTYISCDNNGFYYMDYNGDDYRQIRFLYKSYDAFLEKYKDYLKSWKSIWLYDANTNTNYSNSSVDTTTPAPCKHSSYNDYGKCKSCGKEYSMNISSMSATTYQAVKNDVPVRNRPYSPEKITKYLSKGTKITVVASGKNSVGNLWYKLNDGSWVYSKNLEKVNTSSNVSKTISDGTYVITSKLNNNYVLDISDASKDSGANLQLWKSNGTAAQTFKVSHYKDGYYQIINTNSGKALDVQNGSKEAGANVWQYDINNTDAQLWQIKDAGNGYYYIIGKGSGLFLDVANAYANNGTNIGMFYQNEKYDAQKWKFTKPTSSTSSNSSSSSSSSNSSNPSSNTSSTSIRFELESVPKGNLPYGKSFKLKGWFRSDSAIVEARAYMLDADKNIVMQSDKASSTTSNYKIQGYKLDKAMKFSELKPGGYYLKFYVKDANGDTATWISDKFYIVK